MDHAPLIGFVYPLSRRRPDAPWLSISPPRYGPLLFAAGGLLRDILPPPVVSQRRWSSNTPGDRTAILELRPEPGDDVRSRSAPSLIQWQVPAMVAQSASFFCGGIPTKVLNGALHTREFIRACPHSEKLVRLGSGWYD